MATNKFTMYRGDTKDIRIKYPYSISGMTFTLTVKESTKDSNSRSKISISKIAGSEAADDVENGIVYLTITSTQSAKLSPSTYKIGIGRIIDGSTPQIRTILVGDLEVLPDVLQN